MVHSYDIFETCLVRAVGEPADLFDLVGRSAGLGSGFALWRREAEIEANRRCAGDASLEEIYALLEDWMGWEERERVRVMDCELEEERAQLRPVPEILEAVRASRAGGARVVFLSDMYLPSEFLREMLERHGFLKPGDVVMVSCEEGCRKGSGALFRRAQARLGEAVSQHVGNSAAADVRGARKAGVAARYFPCGNLTAHEARLTCWSSGGLGIGSAWAGAARMARLSLGSLNPMEKAVVRVSAGVAAPLIVAYMAWLWRRAKALGLKRLYFLARDGQLPLEVFRLLDAAHGGGIEARYLHASRIALRFPRQFPMSEEEANGVFQADVVLPLEVVAVRLGVSVEDLKPLLPPGCERGIPRGRVAACKEALARPEAVSLLAPVAEQRKANLRGYLRQEGLFDEREQGIVDLGWGGSLQAGLNRALEENGGRAIRGFYLGLNHLVDPRCVVEAFGHDFRVKKSRDTHWFGMAAELFCQADHGTTLGYREAETGGFEPLLDRRDGDNPLVPGWLDLHRQVVVRFAEEVIRSGGVPEAPQSLLRRLREQIRPFFFFPDPDEARAWGECHFASHGLANTQTRLAAPPRGPRDLLWMLGVRKFGAGRALWPHGAAARLPRPLSNAFRLAHRLRFRLRPLEW